MSMHTFIILKKNTKIEIMNIHFMQNIILYKLTNYFNAREINTKRNLIMHNIHMKINEY